MANARIEELLKKGMEFHHHKQLVEAEACYKEALALDPDNADAIYLLGLLANAIGDRDLAIELISHAISAQPSNPLFHSALAAFLRSHGKTDQAISSYQNALKLDPNHQDSLFGLASLYHELGRLDDAILLYRKCLEVNPAYEDCKGHMAHALFNMGLLLEKQGIRDRAILCYKESLFLSPGLEQSRARLDVLSPAPKIPSPVEERLERGLQYHLNDQFRAASDCYREALFLDSTNTAAHDLLDMAADAIEDQQLTSVLFEHAKKSNQAKRLSAYDADLSICNLKLDLLESKNKLILANQKIRTAEAQVRALKKSASKWNFAEALQLASSLQKNGNLEEALGIGQLVLELHPQSKAAIDLLVDLGVVYHQRFDLNAAEVIYKKILEKDRNNPRALHLLGLVYGQQDQHAKSLDLLEKSIRLAANVPPLFLKNAGLTAENLDNRTKAEEYFRQALAKDKTFPDAYICLSRLLEKQGRFDEAEQCLLQGLDQIPNNVELANQLHYLNYQARDLAIPEKP